MATNTAAVAVVDVETAKRNAAVRAVADHFDPTAKYVGIGSGSTIVYVIEAIVALNDSRTNDIIFVPTGYQSRQTVLKAGLKDLKFDSLPADTWIDVAFDGADEIDEDLNCIKGGGACLYQEKLVAMRAKKFICVADHRKLQSRLLTVWPTIPIEVEPLSTSTVLSTLRALGSPNPALREGHIQKAGPIKTDQDNFIIDAPFPTLLLPADITKEKQGKGEGGVWEVQALATEIKTIEGVLSVGLFCGVNGVQAAARGMARGGQKPVCAYFGMGDGRVVTRVAVEDGRVEVREGS